MWSEEDQIKKLMKLSLNQFKVDPVAWEPRNPWILWTNMYRWIGYSIFHLHNDLASVSAVAVHLGGLPSHSILPRFPPNDKTVQRSKEKNLERNKRN